MNMIINLCMGDIQQQHCRGALKPKSSSLFTMIINLTPSRPLPQILSQREKYVEFLLRLADLGCRIGHAPLRDAARSVLQMAPAGRSTSTSLIGRRGRA